MCSGWKGNHSEEKANFQGRDRLREMVLKDHQEWGTEEHFLGDEQPPEEARED